MYTGRASGDVQLTGDDDGAMANQLPIWANGKVIVL